MIVSCIKPMITPPIMPANISKNVNTINVYMMTLGIFDIAITNAKDRTKANMLMKIMYGNAWTISGNYVDATPLAIETWLWFYWDLDDNDDKK